MSVKGSNTTSDYIEFEKAMSVGEKLLRDEKKKTIGLYIIISVNTGLRISDVIKLKLENLKADTIKLIEKKPTKEKK